MKLDWKSETNEYTKIKKQNENVWNLRNKSLHRFRFFQNSKRETTSFGFYENKFCSVFVPFCLRFAYETQKRNDKFGFYETKLCSSFVSFCYRNSKAQQVLDFMKRNFAQVLFHFVIKTQTQNDKFWILRNKTLLRFSFVSFFCETFIVLIPNKKIAQESFLFFFYENCIVYLRKYNQFLPILIYNVTALV